MNNLSSSLAWPLTSAWEMGPPTTAWDDAALIDCFLRNGGDEAFEILLRRYQDKVFRLAVSVLGHGCSGEAEDITQQIFVTLFRQMHRFRGESKFSSWLYRLARNRIVDYRRQVARQATHLGTETIAAVSEHRNFADPLTAVSNQQQQSRMLQRVDALDEPQRTIIYLHYWQEQSIAEIAELLELKANTIKSHLFRARKKLASLLGTEYGNE